MLYMQIFWFDKSFILTKVIPLCFYRESYLKGLYHMQLRYVIDEMSLRNE